jgi:holo-[acyl-carrier protein] synthase
VRLGIDLLEIARFSRIAAHPGGRRLVFTSAELACADAFGEPRRLEFLAGRFCAKEATAKALGHGLGQGLVWRDIEVLRDGRGAPGVVLRGGALAVAARERVGRIMLSLSHQGGFIVCVALAVPSGTGPTEVREGVGDDDR